MPSSSRSLVAHGGDVADAGLDAALQFDRATSSRTSSPWVAVQRSTSAACSARASVALRLAASARSRAANVLLRLGERLVGRPLVIVGA